MHFAPGYFILLIAPEYFLTLRTLGTQYHARMGAASAAGRLRGLFETMKRGGAAGASETGRATGVSETTGRPGNSGRSGAEVELENVDFAYADRPVLEGLTFSVSPGERLALVGPSGCGKSTVLSLLLGFATPQGGRIALDGRDLRSIDRDELYACIAWLPQRPSLFHGSLRYNIGLGRPEAKDRDIVEAARLAHVDEFAEGLSSGLDTLVGEGGQGLSSGQLQRVALARLFLRAPRLLLLDEPTAHLDAHSEELVNASIAALAEGRTMILVTHRPAPSVDRSLELRALLAGQPR